MSARVGSSMQELTTQPFPHRCAETANKGEGRGPKVVISVNVNLRESGAKV